MANNTTLPPYPKSFYNFNPKKLATSALASQDAYLRELRRQQALAAQTNQNLVGQVGSWYDRLKDITQNQYNEAQAYNTQMLSNADAANRGMVGFIGATNPEAGDLAGYGTVNRNSLASQGMAETNYLSNMIPAVYQTGIDARRGIIKQGKQQQKEFASQLLSAARERDQGFYKNLYDAIDAKRAAFNDMGSYETVRQLLPWQVAQASANYDSTKAGTENTQANTKATLAGIGLTKAQIKALNQKNAANKTGSKKWGQLTETERQALAQAVMGALGWTPGAIPTVTANKKTGEKVSMSAKQAYNQMLRALSIFNPGWAGNPAAQNWAQNLLRTLYTNQSAWPFLYPDG